VVDGAPNLDMMSLWPSDTNPEWIIDCNEEGTDAYGLVRISIADGHSETIVKSGLNRCDPTRRTAWGTIIFGEENGTSGRLFELINPTGTTNATIDPVTSASSSPNIVLRPAVGNLAFEGIALYPNGMMYYGDENRPAAGKPGGAYYKFVPSTPWTGSSPITSLAASPLASGKIYGLRVGIQGKGDYGQATQTGMGAWVEVEGSNLRAAAVSSNLTGYYRPEDFDIDPVALASGMVRWCGNNTGNESPAVPDPVIDGHTYGETVCVTDGTLAGAAAGTSVPEVQFLVIGNPYLAMMDNIAYQPGRGNWILHEDGEFRTGNNDLWSCADDGADDDLLSDGCIRVATLNDSTAEWTGGIFTADGKHFYVSVQHNVTGKGVILDITGWK
jgi:Alkaline phosphatase PhoX